MSDVCAAVVHLAVSAATERLPGSVSGCVVTFDVWCCLLRAGKSSLLCTMDANEDAVAAAVVGTPWKQMWLLFVFETFGVVAYFTLTVPGSAGQVLLYTVLCAVPAVFVVRWSRRCHLSDRPAWSAIAVGCVTSSVADVVSLSYRVRGEEPYPSFADAVYIVAYICTVVGAVKLAARSAPRRDRAAALDAALATVGAAVVVWVLVLSRSGIEDMSFTAKVVTVAYPAIDIALLGAAARLLVGSRGRYAMYMLFAAGMVLQATGDLVYSGVQASADKYEWGMWFDGAWIAAAAFQAFAVMHMSSRVDIEPLVQKPPAAWRASIVLVSSAVVPVMVMVAASSGTWTTTTFVVLAVAQMMILTLTGSRFVGLVRSTRMSTVAQGEAKLAAIVNSTDDLIVVVDRDDVVLYASPASLAMTGRDGSELVGTPFSSLLAEGNGVVLREVFETAALEQRSVLFDVELVRDGLRVACTGTVVDRCDDPSVGGFVCTFHDTSAELSLAAAIEALSFTDALTGLANWVSLRRHVELLYSPGSFRPVSAALCLVNLDGFHAVNELHGRQVGDDLLRAVAQRLSVCTGPDDRVARLDGDEFAVLLDTVDVLQLKEFCARIVDVVSFPLAVGSTEIRVSVSVGVAAADAAQDADGLLRAARVALGESKASQVKVVMFDSDLQERANRNVRLRSDMVQALAAGEFELVYQPIVANPGDATVGVEALLRWHHPVLGTVPPLEFIPLAEASGFVDELGAWVLASACAEASVWPGEVYVSVNVSPIQLRSGRFPGLVRDALVGSGFPAHRLMLELTESALVDNHSAVAEQLDELRAVGVRIAIDDFGTGYNSLTTIMNLPIDAVKVDRSFTAELGGNVDRTVAATIVHMASAMGLSCIAEGVETSAQAEALDALGCYFWQGYLFAKPLKVDALRDRFRSESDGSPEPAVV